LLLLLRSSPFGRVFAGRLVQEEDGTLVFLSNDAGVEFIDAASPVSISELLGNDRFQFEERLCPDIPFELEQLAKGGGGSSAAAAVPILAAQVHYSVVNPLRFSSSSIFFFLLSGCF
jgi:hypothetical protein